MHTCQIDENVKLCVRQVQKQGAYQAAVPDRIVAEIGEKLLHQPGDEIDRNNEQRRLQIVRERAASHI